MNKHSLRNGFGVERSVGRILRRLGAGALVCAASFFPVCVVHADLKTTNVWCGASGGEWGDGANWTLGRAPTTADFTVLPDLGRDYSINVTGDQSAGTFYVDYRESGKWNTVRLTLTGTGKVTASWTEGQGHAVRGYRAITLDGPQLILNGSAPLFYSSLELKNGAKYVSDSSFYFWWGNISVTVNPGCSFEIGGNVILNGDNCAVNISDGTWSAAGVVNNAGVDRPFHLSLDGGSAQTTGDVRLCMASSLSIASGDVRIGGSVILSDATSLELTGGSLALGGAVSATNRRLVTESKGTSVTTLSASGEAMNLFVDSGETVLLPEASVAVTNGCFILASGATVVGNAPLFVKQIKNASAHLAAATLRLKTIVVGQETPLAFTDGNNQGRYFTIEGPTTFRGWANTKESGLSIYPRAVGAITVDTRDWFDSAVKRTLHLRFWTVNGASLRVFGGGELCYLNPFPQRGTLSSLVVEDDTTLVLSSDGTGVLCAETVTLGKNAVLKIPEGAQYISASRWNVDPTAKIELCLPSTPDRSAFAVLSDLDTDDLSSLVDRIEINGGDGKWLVKASDGMLVAAKSGEDVDGAYPCEWTGLGADRNFSTGANWYSNVNPLEGQTHVFGAADAFANPCFDHVWLNDGRNGFTVNMLLFRETAASTFAVDVKNTMTYNQGKGYEQNASSDANLLTYWSICSKSDLPQEVSGSTLRMNGNLSVIAAERGPVLLNNSFNVWAFYVSGDVRLGGTSRTVPALGFAGCRGRSAVNRLTIRSGADLTVSNQSTPFGYYAGYGSLRVEAGATLSFSPASGRTYSWWNEPAAHRIDGLMEIGIPYDGRHDQVYGGTGTLSVSEFRVAAMKGSLTLDDALTLEAPAVWHTIDANGGANGVFTLRAHGTPTLRLNADWTYGPDAAVLAATTFAAADRACEIMADSTLTVDAGTHVATFADPVKGRGRLSITNGTLRVTGDFDSAVTLSLCKDGVFSWTDSKTIGKLTTVPGSALEFSANGPLTVSGDVSVQGVRLVADPEALAEKCGWIPMIVSDGEITGTPSESTELRTRVVATASGHVLSVKERRGLALIVR